MAAVSCRPSLLILPSLYYCLSMLSIHVPTASSLFFNLTTFSPDLSELINCTRDASLSSHTLELTRNMNGQSSTHSSGRAKYVKPVPLWNGATGEMASFNTTFSFGITPDTTSTSTMSGDGMAFFLGRFEPDLPPYDNSGGGTLGLLTNNGTGADRTFIAVEFDTYQNPDNGDTSNSHVGIDINSFRSNKSTDATSPMKNLKSGFRMMATVRYENVTRLLAVELEINGTSYTVSLTIDLRSYLPEQVAVGFSAATGDFGEQHTVYSWSFISTLESRTPPPIIAPAPPPRTPDVVNITSAEHSKREPVVLVVSVLVPVLLVFAFAAVGMLLWKRRKGKSRTPNETCSDIDCEEQDDIQSRADLERGVAASGPRRYTYRELARATNNFADDWKLGRGGFGSVYRGKLISAGGQEDRPVAIKVFSSESSAQGRKEFEAEVRIISRLKHRNLVQLLGWCDSRSGLLLVYELVADGSLDKHLYSSEGFLTWPERYQIILGLGSALRYLHQEWEQCVVHGDIKPSNIMLDESHGTKLGDFGLARLGEHGARWQTTKAVLGTAGYIDPEFVNTRHPSTESDVYSFGIVLLEIVSGRAPVILTQGRPPFVLLKWVWGLYGRNATLDAADERLRGDEVNEKCMERVLIVGLWCAHPEQRERPSIAQAMHVLQSEDARLPVLPPEMYRSVSDFSVTGREYGALSVEGHYSGDTTTSSTKTGDPKISLGSWPTALLQDSKERC